MHMRRRTIEFLGMIGTTDSSEIRRVDGPPIDDAYTREFAQAHEDGGFDRVLIGYGSNRPDAAQVAAQVATYTDSLGLLIAHRPGVVAPTVAARTFATLDHFARGRVALNIVTGGSGTEQRRDGDYLDHDQRYSRTDEYLQVLRATWQNRGPHSHSGEHYRFEGYVPGVLPYEQRHLDLFFGGSSPAAYRVGGKHADTYMLWGEPLAETAEQITSVASAADAAGRATPPRISVSFRPILAPTDAAAWSRAHDILDRIRRGDGEPFFNSPPFRQTGQNAPENSGSQRLLAAAEKGELHDRALWTPTAQASNAGGNTTALVGSPETVAAAILDYIDIGVDTVLIRGYDPLPDAVDYGKHLLPLLRQEIAHREARPTLAEADA
jgi:alkanesulfonate monooxygenase